MRPRYLLALGKSPDELANLEPSLARIGLTAVISDQHLRVWVSEDLPTLILENCRGVILGDVFEQRHPYAVVSTMPSEIQLELTRPDAHGILARHYWGDYIALIAGAEGDRHDLIRAPFGQLPCYHRGAGQLTFIASDVALLDQFVGRSSINWDAIKTHVLAPNLRGSETCLADVDELIGGFGLSIRGSSSSRFDVWNPWPFTLSAEQILDEGEACRMLRTCVNGVVAALARKTKRGVLGVSGGLDSSVVAAALSASGTRYSCVTLFTRDSAGDERSYARSLTNRLGVELFETLQDPANVDVTRCDGAHRPRPIARSFAQSGNRANLAAASECGADSFYSGGGGDNVFCSLQSAAPVADCVLQGRFGAGWRAALDMAAIADVSLFQVLRSGLKRAAFGSRTYPWRPELDFLSSDLIAAAPRRCTPLWADAPAGAVPGKGTHIAFLVGILNHIEGHGRERTHPLIWPLLAQPLIELCLRIPSWLWIRGGINRALVRRAYADLLPPDIIERRSKGTPDCFVAEIFEANRPLLRQFLCDGELAAQGIIDREQIARFLSDSRPVRDLRYWRIMTFADVEAWVQSQRAPPPN